MLQTLRGEGTSRDQIVSAMVEQMGKQAAGEKQGRKQWTLREVGGQTVWDWLHLLSALAIPVVLAIVGLWFTAQQDHRQQQIEDQRAQQAQRIENQRSEAERELAEQRAQDEALQAYLSQMGSLLLEKDLRESEENGEVRTLARARTLTVLGRLDPSRKTAVTRFLSEAVLVQRVEGRAPIISLSSANLNGANLSHANLLDANLREANLFSADLSEANLRGTNQKYANLTNANLRGSDLTHANLAEANLRGANLLDANLLGADLTNAYLGANLKNANLGGAKGVTKERLEQEAVSLAGATMPDFTVHD
jgi:uncharacterized protein YjbI with pentapeptide repeats